MEQKNFPKLPTRIVSRESWFKLRKNKILYWKAKLFIARYPWLYLNCISRDIELQELVTELSTATSPGSKPGSSVKWLEGLLQWGVSRLIWWVLQRCQENLCTKNLYDVFCDIHCSVFRSFSRKSLLQVHGWEPWIIKKKANGELWTTRNTWGMLFQRCSVIFQFRKTKKQSLYWAIRTFPMALQFSH